jgi:hypothetical protein
MSAMDDVAHAALPVAVALLAGAAVARAVVWARVDDDRAQRLADRYLEPLCTWSVIAVGVQLFALVTGGDTGVRALAVPLAVGTIAALLRPNDGADADAPADTEPAAAPAAPAPPLAPEPSAAPAAASRPAERLWSRAPADEAQAPQPADRQPAPNP